jgi:hypothetical protein
MVRQRLVEGFFPFVARAGHASVTRPLRDLREDRACPDRLARYFLELYPVVLRRVTEVP